MIVAIVGPTGVGKTKLSVELAKRLNAEIINADSMQVYQGLDIGTAKVREEEKQDIDHHLFDIVDVDTYYTVYDYQKDCRQKIKEILDRGKNVILVGGTGLYLKAALYDYRFTEGTTYHDYLELSNEELVREIEKYQPTDIHPHNRKRLVRLLNKLVNQEELGTAKDSPLYDFTVIGLTTDRQYLYELIDQRVDKMLEAGLVEEVSRFKNHFSTSKALQTGIGYKEFIPYFAGQKTLSEVADDIKKNSRHYAKRQYTFFRHQFLTEWLTVDFDHFSLTVEEAVKLLTTRN